VWFVGVCFFGGGPGGGWTALGVWRGVSSQVGATSTAYLVTQIALQVVLYVVGCTVSQRHTQAAAQVMTP
jgi:hypothetical protein